MSVLDKLSPRERQVIEHVALRGMSNKLVGRKIRALTPHSRISSSQCDEETRSQKHRGAHPSCRLFFLKLKRARSRMRQARFFRGMLEAY